MLHSNCPRCLVSLRPLSIPVPSRVERPRQQDQVRDREPAASTQSARRTQALLRVGDEPRPLVRRPANVAVPLGVDRVQRDLRPALREVRSRFSPLNACSRISVSLK